MIPVVTFAGYSGSGKTTLLEQVVRILTDRGLKVSVIKHDAHGFDIDKEGKDSHRHKQAGAAAVIIAGPGKHAMVCDGEPTLDTLVHMAPIDSDIIITEGYKTSDKPKIEVYRPGNGKDPVCIGQETLMAVATDKPDAPEIQGAPRYLDVNNPEEVADFLQSECKLNDEKEPPAIRMLINGKDIDLNRFVSFSLAKTVQGYAAALKGGEDALDVKLEFRFDEKNS
ncbi:molybdopterin-guanine dinucleotide biosynthesis protein B [Limisalsivibrio acetivorans]|uniref:molybdopterin-guanine dinucleotide biosynthesis protein B n=1 Tax=Limisalsivibrio acetivorans TaxID=1304888 RepID=UPI0003B5DB71|nr:molybdopterin-guanine dinucleotide biosynthesis protein B [Limisalsivibrio acetivorans]